MIQKKEVSILVNLMYPHCILSVSDLIKKYIYHTDKKYKPTVSYLGIQQA